MYSTKSLVSMLAVGGLMLAAQQAGAVVVSTSTSMLENDPTVSGNVSWFQFGGPYVGAGVANDGNQYITLNKNGAQNAGQGVSQHIAWSDITALQSATDGMALRVSAWVLSDADAPWVTQAVEGFKVEFYDNSTPFGTGEVPPPDGSGAGYVADTEHDFGQGLTPVTTAISSNNTWVPVSFTTTLYNAFVGFSTLSEVRPVYFTGDWTGTDSAGGVLKMDNLSLEVFPDLATANATPLPTSMPGGYDQADLRGDINGDQYVGLDDLQPILDHWNESAPTTEPAGGPVLLTNFSNFALDEVYEQWLTGTITPTATDWTVQANNYGGGYLNLPAPLDATGENAITVDLTRNAGDVAAGFNIVLYDADGTEAAFGITGLPMGAQTVLLDMNADFLGNNVDGADPALDLSQITGFHIQGSFADGIPGVPMDLTFDNMSLTIGGIGMIDGDIAGPGGTGPDGYVGLDDLQPVLDTWNNGIPPTPASVPEPAGLALLGLGGLAVLRRR